MSNAWNWLNSFWGSYGAWITTALIPTIITGLSVSPKTQAEGTWLANVWNKIKGFIGLLSVATPKDVPGTFQAPLKLGKLLKKDTIAILTVIVMMGSLTSCTWFKNNEDNLKQIAIDCGKKAVADIAGDLVPTAITILQEADGWQSQLGALAKYFGEDAVACAIDEARSKLLAQVSLGGPEKGPTKESKGMSRAAEYEKNKKYVFVESH